MSFGVDELMLWRDEIATELTPLDILNKFVRFAEIEGKSNRIRVYFAFDKHGDGFSPNSADKGEHLYEERCSPNSTLVEARRIELRSILDNPQGATSLVDDQDSERLGPPTDVIVPSRFDLCRGHTGYVPQRIPLG